jgi:hypothetical protein
MSLDPVARFKIKIAYEKGFYLGMISGLLIAMLLSAISYFFI